MFCSDILILTLTLLLYVDAANDTNTDSSFNVCYYNNTQDQCPSGEECTIVPPENSIVRRRSFYPEPDPSVFSRRGSRRRKSSSKSTSGGSSSSTSSSKSSSTSSSKSSSKSTSKSSSTKSSGISRYGTSIPRQSYGTYYTGITSSPARYLIAYWWSTPSRYYARRKTQSDSVDLAEYQGICVNETELRMMTQQDCYNWCMSLEYDDSKCANECGWAPGQSNYALAGGLAGTLLICCCCCAYALKRYRKFYKKKLTESEV